MTTGPRPAVPGQGRVRRTRALAAATAGAAVVALALGAVALAPAAVAVAPVAVASAASATTVAAGEAAPAAPADPTATTLAEAAPSTTAAPARTTTTQAPARCDSIAPTAVLFVGTVVSRQAAVVRFRVDEVRLGPKLAGTEVDVSYVRDARFVEVGTRYLVTAALDPDTNLYVSKVRTRRGEDPRCTVQDPIYTTLANGTPIDTAVFAGLRGTRGKVLRAFLLPLGAAVGLLAALVAVKWLAIYGARGVRRLVKGPARS